MLPPKDTKATVTKPGSAFEILLCTMLCTTLPSRIYCILFLTKHCTENYTEKAGVPTAIKSKSIKSNWAGSSIMLQELSFRLTEINFAFGTCGTWIQVNACDVFISIHLFLCTQKFFVEYFFHSIIEWPMLKRTTMIN